MADAIDGVFGTIAVALVVAAALLFGFTGGEKTTCDKVRLVLRIANQSDAVRVLDANEVCR